MPEANRKVDDEQRADLGLDGFEKFFDAEPKSSDATVAGEPIQWHMDRLVGKLGELVTVCVDQRVETAKIANQLIENQRQLVATQQILIRLMERSIELTRHITTIEEKLPAVFELPNMVENLRVRIAQLEGIELE